MSRDPLSMINPHINLALYDPVETPWVMKERVIFDYEFLYVKDGRMTITIEDQSYTTSPGEIYLFRPGQRHSISALEGNLVIQPHVHFDLLQYDDWDQWFISYKNKEEMTDDERKLIRPDIMKELFPDFPSCIVLTDCWYTEFLLFDVIQSFKNLHGDPRSYHPRRNDPRDHDPLGVLQLKLSFLKFFTHMIKEYQYGRTRSDAKKNLASQIRGYLENNLNSPVRMAELAHTFHMDTSYLGRIFREEYQISPIKYHNMMRIRKSHEMLIYTNASITEIAKRMGFETVNDFSRSFKRYENISPAQARKSAEEKR